MTDTINDDFAPPDFDAGHAAQKLRWRPCVGIILLNREGLVFSGKRRPKNLPPSAPLWQYPQGGIDAGETPYQAAMRELHEETGITHTDFIYELPYWLRYDLPEQLIGKALNGQFRGQTQKWFVLRYLGDDADIRLDTHTQIEFDDWAWREFSQAVELVVAFKRPLYEKLARHLGAFCRPEKPEK